MKNTKIWFLLVAVFALVVLMTSSVSAFGTITSVEISGVNVLSGANIAAFAGQTLPVRVVFDTLSDAEDVRVKVWIAGESDLTVSSARFDVIGGNLYSRLIAVTVPTDLDELDEGLSLEILVESRADGIADQVSIPLTVQRESYDIEILDVSVAPSVQSGGTLSLDVVVKNIGRQLADDVYVRARIPALNIEQTVYFGDLHPQDDGEEDEDDAVERRIYLSIPSNVPAGIYAVEIEAYNADSLTTLSKNVAVVGASADTISVSPLQSKTFAVGEVGVYSITLVNTGNTVRVYEIVPQTSSGIALDVENSIVVVPAGTSDTVEVGASALREGDYTFAVEIRSGGETVETLAFLAKVEKSTIAGNTTVLLTVVLAIIFVVLLIVLIVLLTRKPENVEEFGESYY